jgi:hypothetical protein
MEELKDIAPILSQLPKKDSFQFPENYFDELPGLIQDRVRVKAQTPWKTALKYALPFVLLIVSIGFFTQNKTDDTVQISKQEAADYIDNQMDIDFDETLLAEEISVQSVEQPTETSAMEDYLLDEADEELLIEEI